MEEKITVLIPTYNRPKYLRKVLESLACQTVDNFYIVISDNASDYQIEDMLIGLPNSFKERCTIYRRKVNVGADINIMGLFEFCNTKWAWTLSDDEYLFEDSIEKIYYYIEKAGEFGCLNFTITSGMKYEEAILKISSIDEFIDLYYPEKRTVNLWHGDLIFLSNKVFDVSKIKHYLQYSYKYIYTRVSTIVLFIKMLEGNVPFINIDSKIVDYNADSKRSWSIYEVILASRTLQDVPMNLSRKKYKKLLKCLTFNISDVYYYYFVEGTENRNIRNFFDQIYHGVYKYSLSFGQKCCLKMIAFLTKSDSGYMLVKKIFISKHKGMIFKCMQVVKGIIKMQIKKVE